MAAQRCGKPQRWANHGRYHAPWPGGAEEVGVGQLAALDGVLERRGDMFLPDDRPEGRRAVFACADDEITHSVAKIRNMN